MDSENETTERTGLLTNQEGTLKNCLIFIFMKIKKYNLIYFFYLLIISGSVHADYLKGVEAYKDKNYALAFENWSKNDEKN